MGFTQDSEDTIHPPRYECGSQSNHWMPSSLPLSTDRRLRLFGHITRSSPQEDHHRAVAAVIRGLPPDWKRPSGRPSHTWLRAVEADLANRTFALHLPGGRQLFLTTGGALWTQQRSGGVCYKRKKVRFSEFRKVSRSPIIRSIRLLAAHATVATRQSPPVHYQLSTLCGLRRLLPRRFAVNAIM